MTRRNLTTSVMVVGAALLLYGGVALAREQQTREDHPVPAATQASATFDDNGVDASGSPELQASDDHGNGADDSLEASASPSFDDHGNGADDSPEASASPDDHGNGADDSPAASASPDDKTPKPSASPTSSLEDGGGHGGNR